MHIMAPKPADPKIPIFFNVDGSVGHMGENSSTEDILLVQYFLHTVASLTPSSSAAGEARRLRILATPVTGFCDEATIDGIRAWQEGRKTTMPGTVVDGKVSHARAYFYGAAGFWTIVDLNLMFKKLFPNVWPRIQDAPECPALLQAAAAKALYGE